MSEVELAMVMVMAMAMASSCCKVEGREQVPGRNMAGQGKPGDIANEMGSVRRGTHESEEGW